MIKQLNLPRGLNLHVLSEAIPEDKLEHMVREMAGMSRKERRIIFPSQMCLKKCLIHYLVKKFDGDFKKALEVLRDPDHILEYKGLHIGNLKRLYAQREKEIAKENENK